MNTTNNALVLQVDWTGGDDDFSALWFIGTHQPSGEVALLTSGSVRYTKDGFLANLDAALAAEGYRRGEVLVSGGDFDTFAVITLD